MLKLGNRKLISGVVLLATGVAVTWAKGDIPNNLLNLMQSLFMFFIAGNAVEHVSASAQQYFKDKNQTTD